MNGGGVRFGFLIGLGGLEQIVVGFDGVGIDPGALQCGGVVEQQARVEIEGNTIDSAVDRVGRDLLWCDIYGVWAEHLLDVPQVAREAADLRIVQEHAVGHIGASDEGVLQLRIDIDGDVVHLDVGVDGVELLDGSFENLEQVSGTVPDGDLTLGALAAGGFQNVGVVGTVASGDGRATCAQCGPGNGSGGSGLQEVPTPNARLGFHGHSLVY